MGDKRYLIMYTVGPVQSYIAQAARLYDLYAGSRLLSRVTDLAISKILAWDTRNKVIFPYQVFTEEGDFPYPNRCVAEVYSGEAEIQQKMTELDYDTRKEFFDKTFFQEENSRKYFIALDKEARYLSESIRDEARHQLYEHLKTYWAAILYPEAAIYADCYDRLEQLMGSVKTVRVFSQVPDDAAESKSWFKGRCQICGEENAIIINRKKGYSYFLRQGEKLCAVCYQKRCFEKKGTVAFPIARQVALADFLSELIKKEPTYLEGKDLNDEEVLLCAVREKRKTLMGSNGLSWDYSYYAAIVFDGDNIGKWVGGFYFQDDRKRDGQEALTKGIVSFAGWVRGEMGLNISAPAKMPGRIIYAGGEDFLAIVPLKNLFSTIKVLREKFKELVSDPLQNYCKEPTELTFSMGIAIAHCKTPLRYVLEKVRAMEHTAKQSREEKNAVSVSLMKRSGEEIQACIPWEIEVSPSGGILLDLTEKFRTDADAFTFVRKLHKECEAFCEEKVGQGISKKMIESEIRRLIKNSVQAKTITEADGKDVQEVLSRILGQMESRQEVLSWLFSVLYICEFVRASRNENSD